MQRLHSMLVKVRKASAHAQQGVSRFSRICVYLFPGLVLNSSLIFKEHLILTMSEESFNLDELFKEADDDMDETEEDVEKDKDVEREEREKLEKEIKEMKESMETMKKDIEEFKKAAKPGVLRSIGEFVGKTVATGVIFFMVNTALAKISAAMQGKKGSGSSDKGQKETQQKVAKIQAFMQLYKDLDSLSRILRTWFVAHQDEQITLSGITVPFVDIFNKYTKEMADVSFTVFA